MKSYMLCLALAGWSLSSCNSPEAASATANGNLFDGVSFQNWEGDTSYWRIEDSTIIDEVTPDHPLANNTFLIYKGNFPADFRLHLQYQISEEGNSGVQYRSVPVAELPFALKGYQADIDGNNTYTGQNYEERGRGFLALRGQSVQLEKDRAPALVRELGSADSLKQFIKPDWNDLTIEVKGFTYRHLINGVLMSEVVDGDASLRLANGKLGLQLHVAPAMRVAFRNIRLDEPAGN